MRDKLTRLSKAFSNEAVKRLPYVIVLLFILTMVQLFSLSQRTADGVSRAKDNSDKIAVQTEAIKKNTEALDKSVKELKDDNEQQTKILCRLILRGDLTLSDEEASQVEAICKEAIKNANRDAGQTNATPEQNAFQQSLQGPGGQSNQSSSANNKSSGQSSQSNRSQPDNDGVIIDLPGFPKLHIPSPL